MESAATPQAKLPLVEDHHSIDSGVAIGFIIPQLAQSEGPRRL